MQTVKNGPKWKLVAVAVLCSGSFALPLFAALRVAFPAPGLQAPEPETMTVTATDGGMRIHNGREVVQITFCGAGVVHVVAKPADAPVRPPAAQPWIVAQCSPVSTKFDQTTDAAKVGTAELSVSANLTTGALRV